MSIMFAVDSGFEVFGLIDFWLFIWGGDFLWVIIWLMLFVGFFVVVIVVWLLIFICKMVIVFFKG